MLLIAIDNEWVLGQFKITCKYQPKVNSEIVEKLLDLVRQRNQVFYRYSEILALNRQDAKAVKAIEVEIEVVVGRLLQLVPDLVCKQE